MTLEELNEIIPKDIRSEWAREVIGEMFPNVPKELKDD